MPTDQDADQVLFDIGRRIAELRQDHGWTQEQLAEHAEFSTSYLQRLEAGSENLTIRSLVAVAALFGVQAEDLFRPPKSRERSRGGRPRSKGTQ